MAIWWRWRPTHPHSPYIAVRECDFEHVILTAWVIQWSLKLADNLYFYCVNSCHRGWLANWERIWIFWLRLTIAMTCIIRSYAYVRVANLYKSIVPFDNEGRKIRIKRGIIHQLYVTSPIGHNPSTGARIYKGWSPITSHRKRTTIAATKSIGSIPTSTLSGKICHYVMWSWTYPSHFYKEIINSAGLVNVNFY